MQSTALKPLTQELLELGKAISEWRKRDSLGFNQGEMAGLPGKATLCLALPTLPQKLLAMTRRSPRAHLRLRFLAGLGLGDRDFLRRKGKGHTLGEQADGNSWQHWLPSRGAGLCLELLTMAGHVTSPWGRGTTGMGAMVLEWVEQTEVCSEGLNW